MRRGLISWSRAELPEAVLDARVAAAQAAMAQAGIDALAVYTTPSRTAGVSWFTGFVPYWNEGLLVVPCEGRPVLISALSNRVRDWIHRNAHVEQVLNAPLIGAEAAKLIPARASKSQVAAVDLPHLPARVIAGLATGGHIVVDGTAIMTALRARPDPAEIALTARASAIAAHALRTLDAMEQDAGALVAKADGEARRLGAEEVYPAVAVDLTASTRLVRIDGPAWLGPRSAIRLSVAYKGAWVRMTRTLVRDPVATARLSRVAERFADDVARLPNTGALARSSSWLVEGCRTTLPLEPLAGSIVDAQDRLGPDALMGGLVSVQAMYEVDGQRVLVGGPALIGPTAQTAACLLEAAITG